MKSTVSFTVSSLLLAVVPAAAQAPTPSLVLNAMTSEGCFSSSGSMQDQGQYMYQSSGYCQQMCVGLGKAVMGTAGGSNCWCGDALPATISKVSDDKCDTPCNGYNKQNCGGANTWSVALTGIKNNVPNVDGSSSSTSPSTSPTSPTTPTTPTAPTAPTSINTTPSPMKTEAPSVVTMGGATIIVTASDQPTAPATIIATAKPTSSGSKGPNTTGIVVGVVVAVVAIAAIIGAGWLFLRTRRRRAVEEEYRRNAAMNNFTGGGKPSSTPSLSDSRLEPSVMMQRRMSDGSIADNQDYSRRILKVTNPDGT
ncbi:MAG: hypothetical protein M1830_009159 [Pleopsidium flavum]|nr:MAG: hypothetical protein M1830_009159 [Pleopsidium flavum]